MKLYILTQYLRRSSFYQVLILIILLGTAFDNMDQVTCSFILPMMRMEWHLNYIQGSIMPAASLLGTCIGAVLWGMVADRIGRRTTLIYTILLFTITNLIQTHAWNYTQFTITCFFMGIGVGGEIPLSFTLLSEFLPAQVRTRLEMALGILALILGYAFAAVNAHFLLPLAGWKSLFYVQALPALFVLLIRIYIPESPRYLRTIGNEVMAQSVVAEIKRRTGGYNPFEDTEEGLFVLSSQQSLREGLRMLWQGIYLRRTAANWLFGLSVGFFAFGFVTWLPTMLQNLGYSDTQSVNYPMLINFFAIPSVFAVLYLLHKGGSRLVLTLYPLVAGLFMLTLGWLLPRIASHPPILVLMGGAIFFSGVTLLGIFPPYSSEVYPTEIRGTGTGWTTGITRIGSFIGPLVGGILLDLGIPPQYILMIFGAPLLLGAFFIYLFGVQTHEQTLERISPLP
jgi:putative MFS transporter